MGGSKRFSHFLLGFGFGVGLGVLFAHRSGSETRQFIRSKSDGGRQLADSAEDIFCMVTENSRRCRDALGYQSAGMAGDDTTEAKG
jgi:gas vesicle protein